MNSVGENNFFSRAASVLVKSKLKRHVSCNKKSYIKVLCNKSYSSVMVGFKCVALYEKL
jgi:hypothetical protein